MEKRKTWLGKRPRILGEEKSAATGKRGSVRGGKNLFQGGTGIKKNERVLDEEGRARLQRDLEKLKAKKRKALGQKEGRPVKGIACAGLNKDPRKKAPRKKCNRRTKNSFVTGSSEKNLFGRHLKKKTANSEWE